MRAEEKIMSRGRSPWVRSLVVVGALLFGLFAGVAWVSGGAAASVVVAAPACTVTISSENVGNTAVQTAINGASAGARICLAAGVFPEQVQIHTPGITLVGAGVGSTILEPTAVAQSAFDFDAYPATIAPVVLVNNTTAVTVQALTVDGAGAAASITSCSTGYVGIDYQNASGTVHSVSVIGIESSGFIGCGNEQAIYVYSGWFHTHFVPASPLRVAITQSSVASYGKNGITCDDLGVNCTITHDTATGLGPTNVVAQNGIQVAFGANATVEFDTATHNSYSGLPQPENYFTAVGNQAAGILVFSGGRGTTVQSNTVGQNDLGISLVATPTNAPVAGNHVHSAFGDGITADLSFNATEMFGLPSFATAPYLDNIVGNTVTSAPVGILAYDTNSTISGNTVSSTLVGIETVTDNASQAPRFTVAHNTVAKSYLGIALGTGILAQPVGLGPDAPFGGDPTGVYTVDNNSVSGTPAPGTNGSLAGIAVFGAGASIVDNHVSGVRFHGAGSQPSFFNGTTATAEPGAVTFAQGIGVWGLCVVSGCSFVGNTLTGNDLGLLDEAYGHDTVHGNTVLNSVHYGIVADGFPGATANLTGNLVKGGTNRAVGVLLDNGTFNLTGNTISGANDSGTAGAAQEVCGPGAFDVCSSETDVATAAVQVVSTASSGPTTVTIGTNSYFNDVRKLATVTVAGGSITIL